MADIAEKKIHTALKDNEFFETLKPDEMLHVLITDIILNEDVKKANFESWMNIKDRWPEIGMPERMDQVLRVLEVEKPSVTLQAFQKVGFMHFCLPLCFPIKKLWDKKCFYAIIDNFDKINTDDLLFRLNVLMFPFVPEATRQTFIEADLDDEAVEWMSSTIERYMEFIRLNNVSKLKNFIFTYGKDFYFYINDYADAIRRITDFKEYNRPESLSVVNSWIRGGVPLEIADLAVNADDIKEAGSENDEETEALLNYLMEKVLKKPEYNDKDTLISLIKRLKQKQIDRMVTKLPKNR